MDGKLTPEQQVSDWKDSVDDRIDNLCAIYRCAGIRKGTQTIMAADSMIMTLYAILYRVMEDEVPDEVEDLVSSAMNSIILNVVDMLDVPEGKKLTLTEDIIRIVDTRYDLQDSLRDTMQDYEDGDD